MVECKLKEKQAYRLPEAQKEIVEKELHKMLDQELYSYLTTHGPLP